MVDIIQELMRKPECLSQESIIRRTRKFALCEMTDLANKYKDSFKITSADELQGEYTVEFLKKYQIFLSGPPIRRNLRYPNICVSDSTDKIVTYFLSSLPPIFLTFQLNGNYRRDRTFAFRLESAWMPTNMVDTLAMSLSSVIATDPKGMPLHTCCEYLQNQALPYLFSLGDQSSLVLNAFHLYETFNEQCHFVETLVNFEESVQDKDFELGEYECPVCSENHFGVNCVRLRACGHIFCKPCIAEAISEHVRIGANSGSPLCASCDKTVHPVEIKQLVDTEVYEQYETMLLNRTLSSMPNVVECPNEECRNPYVMLNDDFADGVCAQCLYNFCAKCRQAYHPDTACIFGPLANLSPVEARDLVERYESAGPEGKTMLEKQYGKLNMLKLIDEVASNTFIQTECKHCPNCKSPIQKYTGCNRVMCSSCQKNFCWICLVVINSANPYDHFSQANCKLWRG